MTNKPNNKVEEKVEEFQRLFCMQTIIPDIEGQNIMTDWLRQALTSSYEQGVRDERERVREPEKSMDLGKMILLLESEGLNPKNEQNESDFNRWIEFETPYQKCWIEWYTNVSTLRIGDKWGVRIPFTHIDVNTHSPSNERSLTFTNNAVEKALDGRMIDNSIDLTLEKLDWQEALKTN